MGFGFSTTTIGEIVFNTGMVGYTETLTDPSYSGQILTLTYPLVGNYGVPSFEKMDVDGIPRHFESDKIQARGLIVHELNSLGIAVRYLAYPRTGVDSAIGDEMRNVWCEIGRASCRERV